MAVNLGVVSCKLCSKLSCEMSSVTFVCSMGRVDLTVFKKKVRFVTFSFGFMRGWI